MDIQGPFVPTTLGNTYVLNIKCVCTHFSVSLALPNTTALTVATTFLNTWVQFFGAPQKVLTDNGSNFTSTLFEDMLTLMSARGIKTSPYHPQANPVERFGRTLNAAIAKYVAFNQSDWDQYLGLVNFAYNTSVHSVTGALPAAAVFKVPPTTLLEYLHLLPINLDLRTKWAIKGRKAVEFALEQCRNSAFKRVKEVTEAISPDHSSEEPFVPGNIVWLADRQGPRDGRKAKHTLRHSGPYRVVTTNGPFSYWVQHVVSGAKYRVHYHHLSLASESTQLKYGQKVGGEERGGSDMVESISPTSQTGTPTSPDKGTSDSEPSLGAFPPDLDPEQVIVDPFTPDPDYSSNTLVTDELRVPGGKPKHTESTITRTTRTGRVVTVPARYLAMFLAFQTPGSIAPVAGEREEARM